MAKPKLKPPKTHEREWGEGTVKEIRSGVWRAWRARQSNKITGKPLRASQTFDGEQAEQRAKAWARGAVEPAVLLLGHWLDRWLAIRLPLVRPQTERNYRTFVAACGPIAHLPLSTLTTEQLQLHTNTMLKTWKRSSVNSWRAIISSALKAAVPSHLAANPMTGVRLPKPDQQPVKAWRADEVQQLVAAARGKAHETWLWLSLGTGIRLGESRALLWSDVDYVAKTITVSKALDHTSDAIGPTKSGKTRVIDLPDELIPVLRAHRMRQPPKERRVCVSPYSGRMPDPKTIEGWLRRLVADHGITPHPPHSTRHTFATLSLEAGVPLKEVSEALGHANVAITAAIYSHNIGTRSRRAASAVGAVLAPIDTRDGTRRHG